MSYYIFRQNETTLKCWVPTEQLKDANADSTDVVIETDETECDPWVKRDGTTLVRLTTEKAEAEANRAQEEANRLAEPAREQRNKLLTETDWTAMSDVTMTDAMATYRQALRDVTEQDGFPTNITWPTKPE